MYKRQILDIVPEERQKVYDVRKVISTFVDKDSLFELKPNYGKTATTALTRIAGRSVGVIANNPMFKGGAIDPDGCNKVTSFMVLCDSFNIPIVMLVDVPGFLIGVDGGGTGCRAAVATPDGRILAEGKGGRANVSTDCATVKTNHCFVRKNKGDGIVV